MSIRLNTFFIAFSLLVFIPLAAPAEDWPVWRHDASRSAATSEQLPAELHVQWIRQCPPPTPAWAEDPRLQFDASLEPIVAGKTMYVASSRNDAVEAIDTATGELRWKFYANGPVRFAPLAAHGRIYFGCDDGYLYCLDAATGSLLEKIGSRPNRWVLGNERLISVWPVRSGPVLVNGTIYYTTGFWPFEGVFLNSVDVATGDLQSSRSFDEAVHLEDAAPQGYAVAAGSKLYLPCGRSKVLCIDRQSGKFDSLRYDSRGKTDYHASGAGEWLFHGDKIYHRASQTMFAVEAHRPVFTDSAAFSATGDEVFALDLLNPREIVGKDRRGKEIKTKTLSALWKLVIQPDYDGPESGRAAWRQKNPLRIDVKAGNRLYGHQGSQVFAVDLPQGDEQASVSWKATIEGQPTSMLAADGKLFVVTADGRIYCFGGNKSSVITHLASTVEPESMEDRWSQTAARILDDPQAATGYCVLLGVGSGRLIEELVARSELRIIAVEGNTDKVRQARQRFDAAGWYGTRVVVVEQSPSAGGLPPYLANLVVSEDVTTSGLANEESLARTAFNSLRPYGGVAWLPVDGDRHQAFADAAQRANLPSAEIQRIGSMTVMRRVGALPGSSDWTHEFGNTGNTLMSSDSLVKAPLGLLWYGGPAGSGRLFYNRHYWAPSMIVVDGRMIFQGPEVLAAVDVYTGRILWEKALPKGKSPGRRGNFFEREKPGYHLLAVSDSLYLSLPTKCLRIDPATGKTLTELTLPSPHDGWGRVRVLGDQLIATVFKKVEVLGDEPAPAELVSMNRYTGEVRWTKRAEQTYPFVALGADKIFCFDGHIEKIYDDWKRKGKVPQAAKEKAITALDAKTGETLWTTPVEMVVTWLSYSDQHNVVIGSNAEGITALFGGDGYKMWEKNAQGRGFRGHPESVVDKVILWRDQVIDQRGPGLAYDLLTGKPKMEKHPLTGQMTPWEFTKTGHHCNYAIASEHLLTFRASTAGFFDMDNGGTSRLNGFRSGCRNSLIPANGVLNAPNFAHGCVCSYSIFTSLALVHTPENEKWTYSAHAAPKDRVQRVGVNFGAPGDRRADNGTFWLNYPADSGPSPNVKVEVAAEKPTWFRRHVSQVGEDRLNWVTASGVEGVSSVKVTLAPGEKQSALYTVRLHFSEPSKPPVGKRVFSVSLQDEQVLDNLDLAAATSGGSQSLVKEFPNVPVADTLTVTFTPQQGRPILSGIEAVMQPQ